MSVVGSNVLAGASGQSAGGGAGASRSLRFTGGDSAYLSKTFSSAGNTKLWTLSFWYKNTVSSNGLRREIFTARNGSGHHAVLNFTSDEKLEIYFYTGSVVFQLQTRGYFRDASAWGHYVVIFDSDQGTASNRIKMYTNGVLITAFNIASYPSQGYSSALWNNTSPHAIGKEDTNYLDGYLADVHFVDGQSLAPTNFGEYNTDNLWVHKAYGGTYGTNGFNLNFADNSSNAALGTDAAGSNNWTVHNLTAASTKVATFNGTTNVSGSMTALGNQDWTVELFFEKTGSGTQEAFFGFPGNWPYFEYDGGKLRWMTSNTYGSTLAQNQRYHAAWVRHNNKGYIYLDGTLISPSSGITYTNNDTDTAFAIGARQGGGTGLNGYMDNLRVVVGTALYTSNFTVPSTPLTAVANCKLLALQTDLTTDSSGQNVSLTNNGATFGDPKAFSIDSLVDHPTNGDTASDTGAGGQIAGNYATWNPLENPLVRTPTFSDGNLQVVGQAVNAQYNGCMLNFGFTSGKYYCEFTYQDKISGFWGVGIVPQSELVGLDRTTSNNYGLMASANCRIYMGSNGHIYYNSNYVSTGYPTFAEGDVIGLAVDFDAGKMWVSKNGTYPNSGNPATGANATTTFTTTYAPWRIGINLNNNDTIVLNSGQRAFNTAAPAGFKSINTANLPTPTIADGSKYFEPNIYTGNGSSSRSIGMTNSTLSPDFVWIKKRNSATDGEHMLYDIVRGAGKFIRTEGNFTEQNDPSTLSSFNSNGFSLGNDHQVNKSGDTYAAWSWDGGSSTVTNNDGSISSQVRANPTAGFSVITYTGTGSNATVGHGLNAKPSFYFIKGRLVGEGWMSYWGPLGATKFMEFSESTVGTSSNRWNDTEPTNSVFSIGTESAVNTNNQNFVCYCFSSVEGYSSVGEYSGIGGSVGPFVYTGFAPVFVILKSTSHGTEWCTNDIKREQNDPGNARLSLDKTRAEVSDSGNDYRVDFLSNGFQLRGGNTAQDYAGRDYIYIAFASHPFQTNGGLAR